MQHYNLVRKVFRLQQHDPRPSNLVSVDSQSLQPPRSVPATLVERYVTDRVQNREAEPNLLVTSQTDFALPGGVRDVCVGGHQLALECSSKLGSSHGSRFVFHVKDQPLLAKQGPDTYQVKAVVSTACDKITMTIDVKENLWWRAMQLPLPLNFQILGLEQQDHGNHRKIWLELDHALDCNPSDSLTIVISLHNLPGLTGEKPVEDTTNDGTRCSISSSKLFSPDEVQSMKQACTLRTAKLTQKHKVDRSIRVEMYSIETCNSSVFEVKDLPTLKEWCARLAPTNMTAASPNGEAGFSQPLTSHVQHTAQMAHARQQPALPQLSPTEPSSKRTRIVSGLREERQVSSADYDALVNQMTDLKLQINETSTTMVNLQQQVGDQASGLAVTQSVLATLLPVTPHNTSGHLTDTMQDTHRQRSGASAAQSSAAPESVDALSDDALAEEDLDNLLDNMAALPISTLPDNPLIWPCVFDFDANMPTEKLKPVVLKAVADVGPNGCSVDSLAQQLWPYQYQRNDDGYRASLQRASMSLKLTSVLFELNLCQPLVQIQNRIWTYLDSDARKRRCS